MKKSDLSRKWLVCDPRGSVDEAAFQAAYSRLIPLPKLLERAALQADEDIEHVHRLRVATRRADAALNEFAEAFDSRRMQQLHASLKMVRKATGRARDMDVMIKRHKDHPGLVRRLREARRKAQKRIVRVFRKLSKTGKLNKQIRRVLRSIPEAVDADGYQAFHDWAICHLSGHLDRFLDTWPRDTEDLSRTASFPDPRQTTSIHDRADGKCASGSLEGATLSPRRRATGMFGRYQRPPCCAANGPTMVLRLGG